MMTCYAGLVTVLRECRAAQAVTLAAIKVQLACTFALWHVICRKAPVVTVWPEFALACNFCVCS